MSRRMVDLVRKLLRSWTVSESPRQTPWATDLPRPEFRSSIIPLTSSAALSSKVGSPPPFDNGEKVSIHT